MAKTEFEPMWVSPEDACTIGGFSLTTCYELMNNGTLLSKKLGRQRLIYIDSIHNAGELSRPNQGPRPHMRLRTRRSDPPEAA